MKSQNDVIDAFVEHLASKGHPGLAVSARPDEINRTTRDIDAVAGPFAIEHTSVDALDDRRRRDAQWMEAVGGLCSELQGCATAHITISTQYGAVATGQDWAAIRASVRAWVLRHAHKLAPGRHEVVVEDLPLVVRTRHDLPAGIYFGRSVDDGDETLFARVGPLIERKAEKLAAYHRASKTTVLLIESDDIAMMNHIKMYEAIAAAFPDTWPTGVDQIWYADTAYWPKPHFFDMKCLD